MKIKLFENFENETTDEESVNKPDFWSILQKAQDEYEEKVGHHIDNDDYPDYILHAMEKVWKMTKEGQL